MELQATDGLYFCNWATYSILEGAGIDLSLITTTANPRNTRANGADAELQARSQEFLPNEGIHEVSGKRGQALANQGILVVASWQHPDPGSSGHIATVRPGTFNDLLDLDPELGPTIANVGVTNEVTTARDAFGESRLEEVRYYVIETNR